MNEQLTCSMCGEILTEENMYEFDGSLFCRHCLGEQTVVCNCCGRRIWQSDDEGDENISLCSRCRDSYTECSDCGRLVYNDDAYYEDGSDIPYCENCYDRLRGQAIKSYNYKPTPIFHGSGDLFLGIELEVDKGGEYAENAEKILSVANESDDVLYIKHDGSLTDGFELVSEPCDLEYHMTKFPWQKIFEKAISLGYASHNTSTAGLHVHVNRSAFGETRERQEEVVARIIHFVEKNWLEMKKFSRRTESNINRWAARYCSISEEVQETYKKAKDKRLGRYVAVNLENYDTIEFRLFRGTLRYKTFAATLQLVEQICKLAINLTDKEFERLSWSDFVSGISKDKQELIEYLKLKRLYVNDAVNGEGDI